jgi:hypothetical protein
MDQNCAVFQHIKIRNNKIVAQIQLIPVNNISKGNLFLSRVNSVNGQVGDSSRSLVPGVTSGKQVHLIAFDQNLRFSIHSSVQGVQLNTVGGRFFIRGVDVAEIILGIIFVCGLTVDNNSALLVGDTGTETECLIFENKLLWLVEMLLVLVSCAFELGADDGDGLGVFLGENQTVLEPFFI